MPSKERATFSGVADAGRQAAQEGDNLHYASALAFDGNTAKAFDLAVASLSSLGFRITARDEPSLAMIGPGMTSNMASAGNAA